MRAWGHASWELHGSIDRRRGGNKKKNTSVEVGPDVARTLVHTRDDYNFKDFDATKIKSLALLMESCPEKVSL